VGGVVALLLHLVVKLCTRSSAPSAKVAPASQPLVRIEPAGVEFDATSSRVYMGFSSPPASAADLAEVPDLQRGVLYSHPLLVRAWLPLLAGVVAAIVWILCPLSPLYMDTVQGRILGYGALHPDLMLAAVASTATMLAAYWACAKVGDRALVSAVPPLLALLLCAANTALLSWVVFKAADCIAESGITAQSSGVDCTGTAGPLIFASVLLVVSAYLATVFARSVGFAWANPSVLSQPGLPIAFTDAHQRLLLAYLDATRMNTRPDAGTHFSMEDLAAKRKRSSAAGPRGADW
jgi:hypothetical protein